MLQFGSASLSGYVWEEDAIKRAQAAGARIVGDVSRDEVLLRDGYICYLCGVDTGKVTNPFDPSSATVDHVIPLSRGGEHSMANVKCACLSCNSAKRDKAVPAEAA